MASRRGLGIIFVDVVFNVLFVVMACVAILLFWINPPTKSSDAETFAPGNVIVEIRWPDEIDADVDLWVRAPADVAVGYSSKAGRIFNLLRDDLGHRGDATGLNYEVAYARGIPAGEYVVNVHLYRDPLALPRVPVPVVVAISLKRPATDSVSQILTKRVELTHLGQEITVFRFRFDEHGALAPGSVHALPLRLRS